jgi:hypothetical protein
MTGSDLINAISDNSAIYSKIFVQSGYNRFALIDMSIAPDGTVLLHIDEHADNSPKFRFVPAQDEDDVGEIYTL